MNTQQQCQSLKKKRTCNKHPNKQIYFFPSRDPKNQRINPRSQHQKPSILSKQGENVVFQDGFLGLNDFHCRGQGSRVKYSRVEIYGDSKIFLIRYIHFHSIKGGEPFQDNGWITISFTPLILGPPIRNLLCKTDFRLKCVLRDPNLKCWDMAYPWAGLAENALHLDCMK